MFWRKSQREYVGETFKSAILTVHINEAKPIKIVGQHDIKSIAFLVDGKHFVSGGLEQKIRRWRTEDGKEVETPMDALSNVYDIAVSRDGKWIVSGTARGELTVWDAESHEKVTGWQAHSDLAYTVDITPDEKRIITGSFDYTVCVWSISTGQRLLGPLRHESNVTAAKFSPDGRLFATVTWNQCVRVYDTLNGRLLVEITIRIASFFNQSIVWVNNSKNIFALSYSSINFLDVSTGTTLSSWPIHRSDGAPRCLALASNGTFIAVSAGSSVSFWDTTTHKQIGSVVKHTKDVVCMAISAKYDLVIGGGKVITLWNMYNVLPSSYVSALA